MASLQTQTIKKDSANGPPWGKASHDLSLAGEDFPEQGLKQATRVPEVGKIG